VVAQALVGTAIGSVLWFIFGYSLTFGPSWNGLIGEPFHHIFFTNIPSSDCIDAAPSIPGTLYASYQVTQ